MLVFQWNALRVGDQVRIHDDQAPDLPLRPGVVALVQTYPHEANIVGIRLDGDPTVVVHPRRHAVHLGRGDAHDECWRCEATSGVAA
ncbi:MAG TPA: hypothetical protein VGK49_06065 [Ilumatobacteraceae bacterium]|jgi:hypothetical protein